MLSKFHGLTRRCGPRDVNSAPWGLCPSAPPLGVVDIHIGPQTRTLLEIRSFEPAQHQHKSQIPRLRPQTLNEDCKPQAGDFRKRTLATSDRLSASSSLPRTPKPCIPPCMASNPPTHQMAESQGLGRNGFQATTSASPP